VLTMAWAGLVAPGAIDYSVQKAKVLTLRSELSGKRTEGEGPLSLKEAVEKRREIIDAYRTVVGLPPMYAREGHGAAGASFALGRWDSECWHELASEAFRLSADLETLLESAADEPDLARLRELMGRETAELRSEAERAARRAVRLNRLKAQNYLTLALILRETGRPELAAASFERAARLHPSVPDSWFRYAEAAREVEGLTSRVCDAYRKASALDVRETDKKGRFLRGQYHARNLLTPQERLVLHNRLKECEAQP